MSNVSRRLDGLRHAAANGVNLTASIVTLVPIAVAVGGAVAGYVLPALAIALAMSLAGNAYLLWRLRSLGYTWGRRSPSGWLPDPMDLTSLAFSKSDFERAYESAKRASQAAYGPDAEPAFVSMSLMPRPAVHFLAYSALASRHGNVDVDDQRAYVSPGKRLATGSGPVIAPRFPWREDETWRDLVNAAWLLVRPFEGNVGLRWGLTPHEPGKAQTSTWEISFDRRTAGVQEPTEVYQMADGKVVRAF